jgi:hypothetical protein
MDTHGRDPQNAVDTYGSDPRNAEELWIAKYRAALYEAPVQRSRLAKMRATVGTAWHGAISRVGELITAEGGRRNRSLEAFAIPTQKATEDKVKQREIKKPTLPKAS